MPRRKARTWEDVEAGFVTEPEIAFEPISRETVSAQIRSQLHGRIASGELAPGQQMPSERDLADQFQVARTSVREAMQGLLSLGLVERRGNRSYVAEHLPDVAVLAPDDRKGFVAHLFETRRVLEVPIFRLATERATQDERMAVRELAERFHDDLEIEEFRLLDRKFHTTIAASCANALLIELYGKVLDQLFRSHEFEGLLGDEVNRSSVRRIIADSCEAHREISRVFVDGDVDGIDNAARSHLGSVEQSMVDDLV